MIEWLKRLFKREEKMKTVIDDATCIQRLVLNEEMRFKPYRCPAGKLTIGIGRNLEDNPLTKEEKAYIGHNVKEGINADQAFYLCRNDLKKVRADLDRELPWWRELNKDRQFVMIDLCFNMGIGNKSKGLLSFKQTLPLIAQGNYIKATENILKSKYAKDTGNRAKRNAYCLKYGTYLTNLPEVW